ncbi:MAG: sensor histidine kinase, partial [Stellaceae bacterium]
MSEGRNDRIGGGLSARLLVLTMIFVMASVLLVFLPSVTGERTSYLDDRIDAAHLAIFALEATPNNMVSKDLSDMLLAHVGAHAIVVHMADRTLMLAPDTPPPVAATYDLRTESALQMMGDTIATLFHSAKRVVRVLGVSPKDRNVTVEVVLDEGPLRRQLLEFGARVFAVSLIISLITAALVYLTLRWLLVAPLRRMTASMMMFRDNPEDESRVIRPSQRHDEVGLAERELATMQETVRQSLRQKEHLAALGTAVSKINHDLRGILSTARLTSDSLTGSTSPEVKRVVPALLTAIDRAVALCTGTLNYTRESAPPLHRSHFPLAALADELIGEQAAHNGFSVVNEVPAGVAVYADR